jgi:hypothetical protein
MRLEDIRGDLWAAYMPAVEQFALWCKSGNISRCVVASELPGAPSLLGVTGPLKPWVTKCTAECNYILGAMHHKGYVPPGSLLPANPLAAYILPAAGEDTVPPILRLFYSMHEANSCPGGVAAHALEACRVILNQLAAALPNSGLSLPGITKSPDNAAAIRQLHDQVAAVYRQWAAQHQHRPRVGPLLAQQGARADPITLSALLTRWGPCHAIGWWVRSGGGGFTCAPGCPERWRQQVQPASRASILSLHAPG